VKLLLAADTGTVTGVPFDAAAAAAAAAQRRPEPGSEASRAAQGSAGNPGPCRRAVAERLRELESLRREGLVTAEEYTAKRQAILDCL